MAHQSAPDDEGLHRPRFFDLAGAVEKLPIKLVKPEEVQPDQSQGADAKPRDPKATPRDDDEDSVAVRWEFR